MPNTKNHCLFCDHEGYRLEIHNSIAHKEEILKQIDAKTTIPAIIGNKIVCLVCFQTYKSSQHGWMVKHFGRNTNCSVENQHAALKMILATKKTPVKVAIAPAPAPAPLVPIAPVAGQAAVTKASLDKTKAKIEVIKSEIYEIYTILNRWEISPPHLKKAHDEILTDAMKRYTESLEDFYKSAKLKPISK